VSGNTIQKTFGEAVRLLRFKLGISQETLAERADLHRTYISDVERGSRNISLLNIERLARALETSVPMLFSQTGLVGQLDFSSQNDPSLWHLVDVLLVEDNSDDVEMTLLAFKKSRMANRVDVVRDGREALDYLFCRGKYAQRKPADLPQVVLLDLNLPKINGLEVLRRIKADSRTQHLSVVVLTVSQKDWDIEESVRLGADAYIVKPVDFHNLSRTTPLLSLNWALLKPLPKTPAAAPVKT
jgi:CheY-like chemotaxis protein/DNA-binding XRE family transcriptional regulator